MYQPAGRQGQKYSHGRQKYSHGLASDIINISKPYLGATLSATLGATLGVGAPNISGGHAFSANGINWTYTGVAFNASGEYTDGMPFAFSRRERPHPVFAADGVTIVAVTNGVEYQDETTAGGDAVFTFLQPVVTHANTPL
jgi:hypothetical protein